MRQRSLLLAGLAAMGLTLLAIPTMTQARERRAVPKRPAHTSGTRMVETPAFAIRLPLSYGERATPAGGREPLWVLRGRETKIYVKISEARGALPALLERFIREDLGDRLRHVRLERTKVRRAGDAEVAQTYGHALSRRNLRGWIYKFGFIAARQQGGRRVVLVAYGGTKAGWRRQLLRIGGLLRSLRLKG